MALEDALAELAEKARGFSATLSTEEATKNAIVMPFIARVLGYDVFNPEEVIPEFTCDVGIKKGEKIDYAIKKDGEVKLLVECKKAGDLLSMSHASQLVRYFHVSTARLAILTNGLEWHFYTDRDRSNVMDDAPFMRLNLMDIDPSLVRELQKLTKETFDLDSVLAAADELRYVSDIKREIANEFEQPSDEFVKLLARRVYSGFMTARMIDFFTGITQKALKQYTSDRINARLKSALADQAPAIGPIPDAEPIGAVGAEPACPETNKGVVTTEDELEAFRIVRAIVASEVPFNRVFPRDQQSYFSVLLDDTNRKPIARLHFDKRVKQIGVFDVAKTETRVKLDCIEDIYAQSDALRSIVRHYLGISEAIS